MVTRSTDGLFKFEDCLLKHHIRTEAWLPLCKKRLQNIRATSRPRVRRLRYFTFCAVGAIDVLMLDVAKVITRSDIGKFDTVFFFDRKPELVIETQKRIPGAIGFPSDFVGTVLLNDPDDECLEDGEDPLISPEIQPDELKTRRSQLQCAERKRFIRSFPFDVINLDLEEFLFKPNDEFPGKMVKVLRKIFAWQQRKLVISGRETQVLDGFTLMFTTQIGPPNLSADYLKMLQDALQENLMMNGALKPILIKRTETDDVELLQNSRFDIFFKLAMPKLLAAILMEQDWYIDTKTGIRIFEFERPSNTGSYKILHLVMDVKRKNPPKDKRAPGRDSPEAQEAYRSVVRKIFVEGENVITEASIDKLRLQKNLEQIKARRRKYCPDE